jgi:leucyl-tRNA synthetase
MEYPFSQIQKKWQDRWSEAGVFTAKDDSDKQKYYVLSMFPYPSGALHMGHVLPYSISDAIARHKLQEGYDVLQPMGYDAFGMPAENHAIKCNSHPALTTEENIQVMRGQFKALGIAIDWDREISTCRSDYYHWGQWLFKRMYDKGLVYKKLSFVNWCEECQTVLANEQVDDDDRCWRCDTIVYQKELMQWFFKISEYAEELLDYSKVIEWPQRVKLMQTHWIGKSLGTEVDFPLVGVDSPPATAEQSGSIRIFTTRPDTLFGVTFMALPPEHPLVSKWLKGDLAENKEIHDFCHRIVNDDKIARGATDTTKEGVFTGKYCQNPVNGDKVQIWITNYVLMDYGTGAVMAVPAHDQRDFEFAKKYNIPIKVVIQNPEKSLVADEMTAAYVEVGTLVDSGDFDNMDSEESKSKISQWIESKGAGKQTATYRLRDWGISRQRYWGNPIPVIYCDDCGVVLVPDEDLPVKLPEDVQVGRTTQNPLLSVPDWINVPCPHCHKPAKRETDTMDTFVDSSWYFARYTDSKNACMPFSPYIANHWLPVDQYIGGIEHACMHLLYARFFHKFMRDIGLVSSDEPFLRLLTNGMVIKDGHKMSKSKGNTVDPQIFIDRYGSDTVRLFMLFASPPEKDVDWSDDAIKGPFRFLNRLHKFFSDISAIDFPAKDTARESDDISVDIKNIRSSTHATIKKINNEMLTGKQFNTNIAAIMEHFNLLFAIKDTSALNAHEMDIYREAVSIIPKLLYPYAPHLCEEIWEMLQKSTAFKDIVGAGTTEGGYRFIHLCGVCTYDPQYIQKDEVTYVVQINGKVRGKMDISASASEDDVKKMALEIDNVQKTLDGQEIKKIIVVKGKLVSIVA